MSVIAITVRKVIEKVISKMDLLYQKDVNRRAKKGCLIQKIDLIY